MCRLKLLVCLAAASLCSLVLAAQATALPFTVNTSSEGNDHVPGDGVCQVFAAPGVCPLRAAIEEANATPAADTIDFSVPGPFALVGQLDVNNPVTIDGNGSGAGGTVIDSQQLNTGNPNTHRLFQTTAAATFKDLRLIDGGLTSGGVGGALHLGAAGAVTTLDNVTVTNTQITGAATGVGGAIYNSQPTGTLNLTNSTVSDNTISNGAAQAAGAGIYSAGQLNLTDSVVSGNGLTSTGQVQGAGIYADGAFSIVRSTIAGNTIDAGGANPKGAGLYAASTGFAATTIANSTFSGNSAGDGSGGALTNNANGAVTIDNSTFAANSGTAGGADIYAQSVAIVTVRNTILASTAASPCLETNPDTIVPAVPGHNIDVGTSCGFGAMNGNQEMTDPVMTGLTPFGNGQMLHLLIFGSPAIDAADPSCGGGLTIDQRGLERPQGTVCDIGAYERDYRLVTVNKTGTGTVTGTGINCGGDCSESFLDGGADVVLTAAPGTGFQFTSWTGDCESISGAQCTVDVGNHRTVTATFTADPVVNPPVETPAKKKCKKGQKLKKNKCVKKKRKKKK